MFVDNYKSPQGKVTIVVDNGCYKARYTYKGKRTSIGMGKISQETLKASQSLAAVIEYDLIHNCYDETKAKYSGYTKPR